MNGRILRILVKKEMLQVKRNPLIMRVLLMLPIVVMLVIPLVANLDIKHADIAFTDCDHSMLSRRIAADINGTDMLSVAAYTATPGEARALVEHGKADVTVTVPANFARDLEKGANPKILLEANGVNSTIGMMAQQYCAQSIALTLKNHAASMGVTTPAQDVVVREFYNPTMNFRNYMIPALMVMLILLICGFLPALNIVSEKEKGTMEAINVTPVGKFTFILAKLAPYWVVGLLVVTIGMVIGWLVYGLVPMGSIWVIYLATFIFALVMAGIGVIMANNSSTMLQSIFLMFAIAMVFQLMSGLFTPVSSMPVWAQHVAACLPPKYYIEIMRALYLKGASLAMLWPQLLILTLFAILFFTIAALTYRKRS